jgi:NADH-quinone oxidoreductase subunit H
LTLAFVTFAIAALAENNRLPFDLPEAESELIAGYHTEYSSMKFAIFFMSEYAAVITMSAMMTTLFFGGWDIPFTSWDQHDPSVLKTVVTFLVFGAKVSAFLFWYVWVRWTLPRFRFDQLMTLGWKVILPVALAYIMLVATTVWVLDASGVAFGPTFMLVLGAVNLIALVVVLRLLDSNRLVEGAGVSREGRA